MMANLLKLIISYNDATSNSVELSTNIPLFCWLKIHKQLLCKANKWALFQTKPDAIGGPTMKKAKIPRNQR